MSKSTAQKASLLFAQQTDDHTCHISLRSHECCGINFQISMEDTERLTENLLKVLAADRHALICEIVKLKDDLDDVSGQLTDCNQRD